MSFWYVIFRCDEKLQMEASSCPLLFERNIGIIKPLLQAGFYAGHWYHHAVLNTKRLFGLTGGENTLVDFLSHLWDSFFLGKQADSFEDSEATLKISSATIDLMYSDFAFVRVLLLWNTRSSFFTVEVGN